MRNTTSSTPKSLRTYSLAAFVLALLVSGCEGEIIDGHADPTIEKNFAHAPPSPPAPERTVIGQALLVVGDVALREGDVFYDGSPEGLTSVTTADGRFTVLMPHPERVFRNIQMSWTSGDKSAHSPWMRMFHNARRWVS